VTKLEGGDWQDLHRRKGGRRNTNTFGSFLVEKFLLPPLLL
jgi:hypothetical protein